MAEPRLRLPPRRGATCCRSFSRRPPTACCSAATTSSGPCATRWACRTASIGSVALQWHPGPHPGHRANRRLGRAARAAPAHRAGRLRVHGGQPRDVLRRLPRWHRRRGRGDVLHVAERVQPARRLAVLERRQRRVLDRAVASLLRLRRRRRHRGRHCRARADHLAGAARPDLVAAGAVGRPARHRGDRAGDPARPRAGRTPRSIRGPWRVDRRRHLADAARDTPARHRPADHLLHRRVDRPLRRTHRHRRPHLRRFRPTHRLLRLARP